MLILAKAITRNVKISTQKARLAANLIRGRSINDAISQLLYCQLRSGPILLKTLKSAVANATYSFDISAEDLTVIKAHVDQATPLKRSKPKNKGGRVPYRKYMSHFTVEVGFDSDSPQAAMFYQNLNTQMEEIVKQISSKESSENETSQDNNSKGGV